MFKNNLDFLLSEENEDDCISCQCNYLNTLPNECIGHIMQYLNLGDTINLDILGHSDEARRQYRLKYRNIHLSSHWIAQHFCCNHSNVAIVKKLLRYVGAHIETLFIDFKSLCGMKQQFCRHCPVDLISQQSVPHLRQLQICQCMAHHSCNNRVLASFAKHRNVTLTRLELLTGTYWTLLMPIKNFSHLTHLCLDQQEVFPAECQQLIKLPVLSNCSIIASAECLHKYLLPRWARTNQLTELIVRTDCELAEVLSHFASMTKLKTFTFVQVDEHKQMHLQGISVFKYFAASQLEDLCLSYADCRLYDLCQCGGQRQSADNNKAAADGEHQLQLRTLYVELDDSNIWPIDMASEIATRTVNSLQNLKWMYLVSRLPFHDRNGRIPVESYHGLKRLANVLCLSGVVGDKLRIDCGLKSASLSFKCSI